MLKTFIRDLTVVLDGMYLLYHCSFTSLRSIGYKDLSTSLLKTKKVDLYPSDEFPAHDRPIPASGGLKVLQLHVVVYEKAKLPLVHFKAPFLKLSKEGAALQIVGLGFIEDFKNCILFCAKISHVYHLT